MAHQTTYLQVGNSIYFTWTVFIWFSLLNQKTRIDQSALQVFLICPNRSNAQPPKVAVIFCVMQIIFYGCKNVIDTTSMNVFYSMEDNIFSKSLSLLWDLFNRHIVVFFETSVWKEVRILRFLYNNSAVLIPKFQNKAMIYHSYTW